MGNHFAEAIKQTKNAELNSIASLSNSKLNNFSSKFNIDKKNCYNSYEELIKSDDVDAVYISTLNNTHIDLVKKLLSIVKFKKKIGKNVKIKFVKDRPGHDIRYAIDSGKIKNELKWKPKVNFIDGLKKTYMWYFNNQKYFSKFNKKDITKRLGIKK